MSTCRAGHGCCGSDTGSPNTHFGSMVRLTTLHRATGGASGEAAFSKPGPSIHPRQPKVGRRQRRRPQNPSRAGGLSAHLG
jgi:hypothetical protein